MVETNLHGGPPMANQDVNRLPKRIGGSNKLISLKDTAAMLDVPESSMYKNWRTWGLKAYRVGRSLKFRERDVEAWLDRQLVA
jgi:excisionase family DNA binding protein